MKLVRPLLAAAPRSVKTRTALALIANVDQTVDVKLVRPPVDLSPHLQQRNFSSLEPSLSLLQQVPSFSSRKETDSDHFLSESANTFI